MTTCEPLQEVVHADNKQQWSSAFRLQGTCGGGRIGQGLALNPTAEVPEMPSYILVQPAEGSFYLRALNSAADGWGGDQYQLFISGSGAVAFSYVYVGDAEAHTEEMTQAFIDFAEDVLELGEGTRTDGGVAYAHNDRPWVFIDREAAGLLVMIASDGGVGADLAAQLSPP